MDKLPILSFAEFWPLNLTGHRKIVNINRKYLFWYNVNLKRLVYWTEKYPRKQWKPYLKWFNNTFICDSLFGSPCRNKLWNYPFLAKKSSRGTPLTEFFRDWRFWNLPCWSYFWRETLIYSVLRNTCTSRFLLALQKSHLQQAVLRS